MNPWRSDAPGIFHFISSRFLPFVYERAISISAYPNKKPPAHHCGGGNEFLLNYCVMKHDFLCICLRKPLLANQ